LERSFFRPDSEGKEFVINRYRDPERSNLGTQFARIVKMAGIEPVPRPFDNMRASRSTEVYASDGAFLESKWIGHSTRVARDHYLQVREEDFERTVGGDREPGKSTGKENYFPTTRFDFPTTAKKISDQFSDQQRTATSRTESQQEKTKVP
jgi:hypothetical protein